MSVQRRRLQICDDFHLKYAVTTAVLRTIRYFILFSFVSYNVIEENVNTSLKLMQNIKMFCLSFF